jgi:uncharacterized membrane protein YcaP (DUF421 family)
VVAVWSDVFSLQVPAWEKVVRTVLVYGGLAVLLRLAGKRDLAQLNTFDLVVMLLLSNVVQNAVIGNDNSLTGGLLGAAVLIAVNAVWIRLVNGWPRLTRLFEGTPTTLVRDGRIVANLRRLGLRRADVAVALRRQGADSLDEVATASLEPGGSIVMNLRDEDRDLTTGRYEREHAELLAELRALSAKVDALRDGR